MNEPDPVELLAAALEHEFDESMAPKHETFQRLAALALRSAPELLADPQAITGLVITTLYGARLRQPMVQIEMEKPLKLLQLKADDVLKLSLDLAEAAQAALMDAFLVEFFQSELEMAPSQRFALFRKFREWREARVGGQPGTEGPYGEVKP